MLRGIAQVITAIMSGGGVYGFYCLAVDLKILIHNRKVRSESDGTEQ